MSRPAANANETTTFEAIEARQLFSTFVVTTTADSGDGSFRSAINAANAHPGRDAIRFAIGSGAKTIAPLTQLPQLTGAVSIDATSQPGHNRKPLIELSGANCGGYGLVVRGGDSSVAGLAINRFSSAILITDGNHNTIAGCYLGTDLSGYQNLGNTDKGIIIQSAFNLIGGTGKFARNVISGNANNGIQLYTAAAKGNVIAGNYIGTNADGTGAIANGSGIGVTGGVSNTIGGRGGSLRNVISGNTHDGIVVNDDGTRGNLIAGNYIGTNAAGTAAVGNGDYGVEISQASNVVGGARAGQGNVISGNGMSGVALWLASAHSNVVLGNFVGTDAAGTHAIGNAWCGIEVTNGASGNVVGGTRRGAGNLVSGNIDSGIKQYQGSNNAYMGNWVGMTPARGALGNGHDGIQFLFATGSWASGNVVGNNSQSGISQWGSNGVTQKHNTILNDTLYGF